MRAVIKCYGYSNFTGGSGGIKVITNNKKLIMFLWNSWDGRDHDDFKDKISNRLNQFLNRKLSDVYITGCFRWEKYNIYDIKNKRKSRKGVKYENNIRTTRNW